MSHDDVLCDCVVTCGDVSIQASTYAMVKASNLCLTMLDDMVSSQEPRVFEFPVGDTFGSSVLRDIVDVIHKRLDIESLDDCDRIASILDAAEYLQVTNKITRKLSKRLWTVLRGWPNNAHTFTILAKYSNVLLENHHTPFLSKARNICPEWHKFRLLLRSTRMFSERAVAVFKSTCHIFPSLLLLHELVMASPDMARHAICMSILGLYNVATYFHPEEYTLALEILLKTRPVHDRLVTPHCQIANGCIISNRAVNLPSCMSRVGGSFLLYSDKPKASMFMNFMKPLRRGCPKLHFQKGIGCMWVHVENTTFGFKLHMTKLPHSSDAYCCWVRVVPFYSTTDELNDVNYADVDDVWTEILVEEESCIQFSMQLLRGVKFLRFVRVDVFWLHDPRAE